MSEEVSHGRVIVVLPTELWLKLSPLLVSSKLRTTVAATEKALSTLKLVLLLSPPRWPLSANERRTRKLGLTLGILLSRPVLIKNRGQALQVPPHQLIIRLNTPEIVDCVHVEVDEQDHKPATVPHSSLHLG